MVEGAAVAAPAEHGARMSTHFFSSGHDARTLVRRGERGGGHMMSNRRTCTRCGEKREQRGGTVQASGKGFVCRICKEKASIQK